MSDTLPPLPKGATAVTDGPALPEGAVMQPESAYDRFLNSLRNPQTGGKSGVVGPMLMGGAGELIKGVGALGQMVGLDNAGNRMVEVGSAMTQGAKSVAPVAGTVGQYGSYVLPFSAAQKGVTAVGNIPKVAQNLQKIPSFARATGEQALIGGATGYALTPDQENRGEQALYGAGGGVFGELVKPAVQGMGYLGREALGLSTGAGRDAVGEAFKAGTTKNPQFLANLRGKTPVTDVLEAAQSGLQTLKNQRKQAYEQGIESTNKNQVFLDFNPIEKTFNDTLQGLTVKGVGGVSASRVGDKTLREVDEINKVVQEWKAKPELHTAQGLDALKRRIDDLYSNDMSKEAKSILTQTRGQVKQTIVKQDPNYAKTMRDYEESLGVERELEQALGLGDKTAVDTAVRKLQSLMRNNANTSYAYRKQLADTLKKDAGVDLMPALAGQALNSFAPRGIQQLVPSFTAGSGVMGALTLGPAGLVPLATLPLQSPRLVGEGVYAAGRASRPVIDLANSGTPEQRRLAKLLIMNSATRGATNE
jgi:hypothetical protein